MSELRLNYPLVSVIVPTYNNEARIVRTLESIIAQNYPNIEIIVVNDVSTDATADIARQFPAGNRLVRIIERSANGGQSAARNTGLDLAQGKYVIFFDHDDLAEKNYVSSLCAEAERTGADVVFCGYKHYYEAENRYTEEPIKLASSLSSTEDYVKAWLKGKIFIGCVWCHIFRRDFLYEKGIRFKEGCYVGEDSEFSFKALALSGRTSIVKDSLYIYIHHSSQQHVGCGPHAADFQRVPELMMLSWHRAARFIAKRGTKRVRGYMVSFCIPKNLIKRCTVSAEENNAVFYKRQIRMLRHRAVRKMLLSTAKFFCFEPEVFLKAVLLLWCPNLYYWLRS